MYRDNRNGGACVRNVLVYLSGPITAKNGRSVEQNVATALPIYFNLLRAGIPAFCPHLSAAFPSAFEVDYRIWMDYDFAVIARCTHLLTLPNYRESLGALEEINVADRLGIPVFYDIDGLITHLNGDGANPDEVCAVDPVVGASHSPDTRGSESS